MLLTLNGPKGPIHMINAYSDSTGSAIWVLYKHRNLPSPISYLGGNFNCPLDHWDVGLTHCNSPHVYLLKEFTENHGLLCRSLGGATHFPDNGSTPSILDFIFLPGEDHDSVVTMGHRGESDHCLFFIEICFPILVEAKPPNIKAGSKADAEFTFDIMDALNVIADHVQNSPASLACDDITHIMTHISECFAKAWEAHASSLRTLVQLKGWWDAVCAEAWHRYKESDCSSNEWCNVCNIMKNAKCKYFDEKIEHIASNNKRPWDLMSWVHAPKPDSSEAIIFKGKPCLSIEDSWNVFQETFNSTQSQPTYPSQLGQALHPKPKWEWAPFNVHEMSKALVGCSG